MLTTLALRQQTEQEIDRQPGASDDGFAGQHSLIGVDIFMPVHGSAPREKVRSKRPGRVFRIQRQLQLVGHQAQRREDPVPPRLLPRSGRGRIAGYEEPRLPIEDGPWIPTSGIAEQSIGPRVTK